MDDSSRFIKAKNLDIVENVDFKCFLGGAVMLDKLKMQGWKISDNAVIFLNNLGANNTNEKSLLTIATTEQLVGGFSDTTEYLYEGIHQCGGDLITPKTVLQFCLQAKNTVWQGKLFVAQQPFANINNELRILILGKNAKGNWLSTFPYDFIGSWGFRCRWLFKLKE